MGSSLKRWPGGAACPWVLRAKPSASGGRRIDGRPAAVAVPRPVLARQAAEMRSPRNAQMGRQPHGCTRRCAYRRQLPSRHAGASADIADNMSRPGGCEVRGIVDEVLLFVVLGACPTKPRPTEAVPR